MYIKFKRKSYSTKELFLERLFPPKQHAVPGNIQSPKALR